MDGVAPNFARFGAFELDLRARELRKHGLKVGLPEQSIQILAMLVERSGEVVLRGEIRKTLWPNDTMVEFDHSINAAINRLRGALGDEAGMPRYIETLPRRGYRFLVPVEWVEPASPPAVAPVAVATEGRTFADKPIGAADLLGKKVSHYRVLEILGGGGMGVVYKAEDIKLGRTVALKFLPEELANDRTALGRFEREARATSALNHPNICTVYEFGEHEGQPFIAMEFLEGQTLRERIGGRTPSALGAVAAGLAPPMPVGALGIPARPTQGVPLQVDELLNIAIQIADGLETAHQKGVIHRDIKPANIFITKPGQAKILDFGVAKLSDELVGAVREPPLRETRPGDPHMTLTGVALGTASYMSPEQVRGEKVDARTDLFSFGLVLYEMATGQQAFRGETAAVVRDAILNRTPAPARDLNPELPLKLPEIIDRALQRDRETRYQAASEMRAGLKAVGVSLAPAQGHPQKVALRWAAASALALLVVGGVFLRLTKPQPDSSAAAAAIPTIRSIAVLPLQNLSGDPAQEYFSDGMTDALITDLAQIGSLRVISRTSSMQYKGTRKSLPDIARELNVDAIVEGTLQRSGDRVKITAQLIHGPSDKHLWAKSYERDMRDVFTLEREVTDDIANQVRAQIAAKGQPSSVQPRPLNLNAWYAYLQGKYLLNKSDAAILARGENLRKAGEFFQHAIDADPAFVSAYIGLAEAHHNLWWPSSEDFLIMQASAAKALKLAPTSSDAHLEMAVTKWEEWDWIGAEEESRRAIALNPNNAGAHETLGDALDAMGQVDEAWKEYEIAQRLDPNQDHISWPLLRHDQYDRTIELSRRLREARPGYGEDRLLLSIAFAQKGMHAASVQELEQYLRSCGLPEVATRVGRAFANSGWSGALLQWAKELERLMATKQAYLPAILAQVYVLLGDKDQAFYWLEQGNEHRHLAIVDPILQFVKIDPSFAPLHSDPRFKALLRKMGLPE